MTEPWLYLLLVGAVAAGWGLGFWQFRRRRPERLRDHFSEAYFLGLTHLIDNRTDQAIDSFVRALQHDSATVPLRIALGTLYRRKGELARATEIHRDILASPDLTRDQVCEVELALAEDYLAAGLLDRAEELLEGLLERGSSRLRDRVVMLLLRLLERSCDWQKALEVAGRYPQHDQATRRRLAHYCCELADEARRQGDEREFRGRIRQARIYHPDLVRATLLLAEYEMAAGNWKTALRELRKVPEQDARFVSESLPGLIRCYRALDDEAGLRAQLERYAEQHPCASVMIALAEQIAAEGGPYQAASWLTDQLKRRPNIRMFNRLMDFHLEVGVPGAAEESLMVVRGLAGQLMLTKPVYRCESCGFAGRRLHWHCPGCRQWGTLSPIQGLEGE